METIMWHIPLGYRKAIEGGTKPPFVCGRVSEHSLGKLFSPAEDAQAHTGGPD